MTMKKILIWSLVILLFLNHTALVYADEVSEAGEISEADEVSEASEISEADEEHEEVSDETIDLVDVFYTNLNP